MVRSLPLDRHAGIRGKRKDEPTPPSAHSPGFNSALEAVILRAISRKAADRQTDGAELLADLRNPTAMKPRQRHRHWLASVFQR